MIQCRHLTCHACACAGCAALLDGLEALCDCGQEGVCRVPPGCARHWEERNRALVAECDALRADADDQFRLGREAGIETSRGPLADFQRRAEKAEAQLEFLEDGRTYAADFHRRAEKAKDEALRAALASIASAYRIPACWPANLSRLVSVAVCAQQVRDEAQQTRDAAVTEVLAWRTATGCDTPAEAAEVRRRWEAEDAEQASDMARLRELEAAVLELDASSGGDDVWDLDGSDEERRARAAIAACRAARKPPGDGEGT